MCFCFRTVLKHSSNGGSKLPVGVHVNVVVCLHVLDP